MTGDMDNAKALIIRYWDQVWTLADPEAPSRFYAQGATENGDVVDPIAFAQAVRNWREKFPDFAVVVDEVLEAEGRVLSRVTYRGTHRGTWAGIPPTGRMFSMLGLDLWRIEDDRIVEHWHVTDHLDLVFALGGRIAAGES